MHQISDLSAIFGSLTKFADSFSSLESTFPPYSKHNHLSLGDSGDNEIKCKATEKETTTQQMTRESEKKGDTMKSEHCNRVKSSSVVVMMVVTKDGSMGPGYHP